MMFATLFCGVLDSSGLLTYCNCGHNPPLVVRKADGRCEGMHANSPPLGIEQGITYKAQTLALSPGDLVLLYTDGVTEAENADGVQFGVERLEQGAIEMRDDRRAPRLKAWRRALPNFQRANRSSTTSPALH